MGKNFTPIKGQDYCAGGRVCFIISFACLSIPSRLAVPALISTTLLDLEVKDYNIIISENTLLKKIKNNKNFHGRNAAIDFQNITRRAG